MTPPTFLRPAGARLGAAALMALAAAPAFAGPGRLGGGEPLEVSLGRIVAALLICIVIAFLAVLMIRQRGGRFDLSALVTKIDMRRRALRVVETRRLSPHADLCIVEHEGCEYLLLLMAGDARILNERRIEAGPPPAVS